MRPRVLIVEDNADLRHLYAIALNKRGFQVKLAANGKEAVERFESEQPDVILLDWLMPIMDGGELLARLGGGGDALAVPIIVISGKPSPPREDLDPRIQAWLTKPVSLDDLVAEIRARTAQPAGSGQVR